MKLHSIVTLPIAFVAGILCIVLLQRVGIVTIDIAEKEKPSASAQLSAESNVVGRSEQHSGVQQSLVELGDATSEAGSASTLEANSLLNQRIDELQQQVRFSTVKADAMQAEIDQLGEQLETATLGNEFLPSGQGADVFSEASSSQAATQAAHNRSNRGWQFDSAGNEQQYASLVSAGIDPSVAQELKQRNDQWTLQRLELVDQATREGWRRSEQFGERMSELREERPDIRAELGDDSYDRYLYAAGEFNRVRIASIIDGSAAFIAGMENGDVVTRYSNQRIFTLRELQQATSAGSRGESVQVEVLRNTEQLSLELPRGPLGVTLVGARVEPTGF